MFTIFFKILITNFFYIILGNLTYKFFFKYKNPNTIDNSILGLIFFCFISLLINFFFPLNIIVNSSVIFLIIIIFIIKKVSLSKKDLFFLFQSSLVCFLLILYDTEFRPDAGLYHIPFVQILNESNIIIGLSNLHERFGHISIIQYLSAINFNLFTDKIGIILPLASFCVFLYFYFFYDIYKLIKKKEGFSYGKIFSLFIIIYITYKINRYGEFGNDAPAHLFIFYLISKFIYFKKNDYQNANLIYLYSVFAFLNKVFFIFAFLLPFFIFLKNKTLFKKMLLSFPSIFLLLWFLKNILISGCLIFPMKNTCFDSLKWTNMNKIESHHILAEAWAKSWPQNKNKNITIKNFSQNFNWIEAWSSKHFPYIVKIFFPYISMIFFLLIFFNYNNSTRKNNLNILINNQKYLTLALLAILGVGSFFLKYPIYRYGYSYMIIFSFLALSPLYNNINVKKYIHTNKIIFTLCLVVFFSKQYHRIYIYSEERTMLHEHIFIKDEIIKKNYEKVELSDLFVVFLSKDECFYYVAPCTNYMSNLNSLKSEKKFIFNTLFNNYK